MLRRIVTQEGAWRSVKAWEKQCYKVKIVIGGKMDDM